MPAALSVAIIAALVALRSPTTGFWSKEETKQQAEKTVKVWKQPHSIRIAGSKLSIDTVSQGALQWQVRATEPSNKTSSALFVAREDGGNVVYGVNYDSEKSKLKPLGNTRVSMSATGDEEGNDVDWTVSVEGKKARHFSITGNSNDVVYDAALGWEKQMKNGVSLLYAVDAKKRSGMSDSLLPNWIQSSAGLEYSSKIGDLKMNVFQPDPETEKSTLEWEAALKGRLQGLEKKASKVLSTDPQYVLKISESGLDAKVRAPAKLGTAFGADATVPVEGTPTMSGFAEWKGKSELRKGLELNVDAKATVKERNVSLAPVGLGLSADLATLAPGVAAAGSNLYLRSRYKLGSDRPSLTGTLAFRSKQVPEVKAAGVATLQTSGDVSGAFRVTAENLHGVDARYEMSSDDDEGIRQAAEVKLPRMDFGGGGFLRGTGKVYRGREWGEQPRVQLGVQYEGDLSLLGKSVHLGGESAGFDSGRNLLDEMGKPWKSPELKKAKNSAKVLRKRIQSEYGEGRRWISK